MQHPVDVQRDSLPVELVDQMIEGITAAGGQKSEMKLGLAPESVQEAARILSDRLQLKFNWAETKRYRVEDEQPNGAYEFHVDPLIISSVPLVLLTLSGAADLYVRIDGEVTTHRCVANTLAVMKARVEHAVSPPDPTVNGGQRDLLFLGWNTGPKAAD